MSTFRVVQFNMQFAQGWAPQDPHDGAIDFDATLAEIRRHDADIVLLQEVERAQPNGAQPNPPPNYTRLCTELKVRDSWFAYPKADERELPFGIGLAILASTPLREKTRIDLPSPHLAFEFDGKTKTPTDRLLIGAKTTIQGREVQLLNTHLLAFFMLGANSEQYPEQRAIVARQLAESRGPTILGGDFNVRNHASLVNQYSAIGYRTVQDGSATWRRQPYVLDHLFYNQPLRMVRYAVEPTLASDHHVLVADFAFT